MELTNTQQAFLTAPHNSTVLFRGGRGAGRTHAVVSGAIDYALGAADQRILVVVPGQWQVRRMLDRIWENVSDRDRASMSLLRSHVKLTNGSIIHVATRPKEGERYVTHFYDHGDIVIRSADPLHIVEGSTFDNPYFDGAFAQKLRVLQAPAPTQAPSPTQETQTHMDTKTYDAVSKQLIDEAHQIEAAKRPAYTIGSPDVLANFKRVADRTGATPGQVLATYMLKHVDAVTSALCQPGLPQAEAIIGRFADLINYCKLGYALISERDKPQLVNGPTNAENPHPTPVRRPNVRPGPTDGLVARRSACPPLGEFCSTCGATAYVACLNRSL